MQPRLIAVSGPLEGRTVPIDHDVLTFGRHSASLLRLPEVEVSRHHCELRRDGESFVLRDLDSRHGIFVNSVPVRERVLAHGDVIRIGSTALLFLLDEPGPSPDSAPADADDLDLRSTFRRLSGDSLYLRSGELRRSLSGQSREALTRIAGDLEALVEIAAAMHEARRDDALCGRLLELLLAALPAERGCVLLPKPGEDQPTPAAVRGPEGSIPSFRIRRALLARVLEQKVGILGDSLLQPDPQRSEDDSGSFLCAPLQGRERMLGALYFDRTRGGGFTESDLDLVTAAARIAALALDNFGILEGLRRENRRLQAARSEHGLVGESPALRRVVELIERVGPVDSTVLVRGESGTGKELAARAIHRSSQRADGPFIAVNCATLSETLLESELFGHERGAFTGAVARKIGKLESADGGTLFLDEVGEIPPPLQARLLRVLQEREIERVGGTRPIPVDVRLVAATNRDLEAAIRDGVFRQDLFYRLNVITLAMPALRERRQDVPLLARHFADLHGRRLRRRDVGLTPEARRLLLAYDWPGNVRQLANAVERAVVLGDGELIHPEDLPDEVLESGAAEKPASEFQAAVTDTKKKLLLQALDEAGGNAAAAARKLGLHPNSLRRLLRQLGLKSSDS